MYGRQIEQVISNLELVYCHFNGIYMIDEVAELYKKLTIHGFVIVNTQPSSERGKHWFVLYKSGCNSFEIFDPLGFPSFKNQCIFQTFGGQFYYNIVPVQPPHSDTCALFCITFAVHRIWNIGETFDNILYNLFDIRNLRKNNLYVRRFCNWIRT